MDTDGINLILKKSFLLLKFRNLNLKELQNRVLHTILVWSFFCLTLIWVGFLGVRFEVGEGGKITPPPMNLTRTYISTHTYVVSENIPLSTKAILILMMSAFFCKKSPSFGKNSTHSNIVRAVLKIF